MTATYAHNNGLHTRPPSPLTPLPPRHIFPAHPGGLTGRYKPDAAAMKALSGDPQVFSAIAANAAAFKSLSGQPQALAASVKNAAAAARYLCAAGAPRRLDQAMGAGLDKMVEARRLAAAKRHEMRPVAVDLHNEEFVGERTQQRE